MQMDIDGRLDGEPIAVNIGTPSVAASGIGDTLQPLMLGLRQIIESSFGLDVGDVPTLLGRVSAQTEATNPTIEFSNIHNKGFVAVTITHEETLTISAWQITFPKQASQDI